MNLESYAGASAPDTVLQVYRNNADTIASLHKGLMDSITDTHRQNLIGMPVPDNWYATDLVLQQTEYATLGGLQPGSNAAAQLIRLTAPAIVRTMQGADKQAFYQIKSVMEATGASSAESQQALRSAQVDNPMALLVALDDTMLQQLNSVAVRPGGVLTPAYQAIRERFSPIGEPVMRIAMDTHVFAEAQHQADTNGVASPELQRVFQQASGIADVAIRSALDRNVWDTMQSAFWNKSQEHTLPFIASLASCNQIVATLLQHLTGESRGEILALEAAPESE